MIDAPFVYFKQKYDENTYKCSNKLRFPISFGIFPDILFKYKFLNNSKIIKMINMIFIVKYVIDVLPFAFSN